MCNLKFQIQTRIYVDVEFKLLIQRLMNHQIDAFEFYITISVSTSEWYFCPLLSGRRNKEYLNILLKKYFTLLFNWVNYPHVVPGTLWVIIEPEFQNLGVAKLL